MKLYKFIGRFLKIGTLLSTTALILSVLLQIYARFFMESAPSWTEEASRLFFIYAVSFASGLALRSNYYVHLDMFYNKLPYGMKRFLNLLIPTITFLLFAVLLGYSFQMIALGMLEMSPSLEIPMGYVFFSMAIMAASICYYSWIQIRSQLKNRNR